MICRKSRNVAAEVGGGLLGRRGGRQTQRQVTEKVALRDGARKWVRDRETRDRGTEIQRDGQGESGQTDTQTDGKKLGRRQRDEHQRGRDT